MCGHHTGKCIMLIMKRSYKLLRPGKMENQEVEFQCWKKKREKKILYSFVGLCRQKLNTPKTCKLY